MKVTYSRRPPAASNPHAPIHRAPIVETRDSPARVQTSDLKLDAREVIAIDLAYDEKIEIFDEIELPPHSARVLKLKH